jgi:hypothetical protein
MKELESKELINEKNKLKLNIKIKCIEGNNIHHFCVNKKCKVK